LTILADFELHANSNGRKYLSALITVELELGSGRADDPLLYGHKKYKFIMHINILRKMKYIRIPCPLL